MNNKFVLITPARNEEKYIEETIKSVIGQTILPVRWIIVSDNSSDRTDEIIIGYSLRYKFIKPLIIKNKEQRNFGSKVIAFKKGYDAIDTDDYDFIGNLDADVSFAPDYFEKLLLKFFETPQLGIGGGIIVELINQKYVTQTISENSVAGAVQLFNRNCYEDIGGYLPIKSGGIDSLAEIKARMKGWEVRTFREFPVLHHRRIGTAIKNVFSARFNKGVVNYLLGYHPLFQLLILFYRVKNRPFIIGSILTFLGYCWAWIFKNKREVSDDIVSFLRAEQLRRIGLSFLINNQREYVRNMRTI